MCRAGDCNQDGQLDISDAIWLLGFLFLGRPGSLPCGDGAGDDPGNLVLMDANGDAQNDMSDAVQTLGVLFCAAPPCTPHPQGTECTLIQGCDDVCGG